MSLSTVLAKALYDNAAESPEELAFRKGDILMVLEQEHSGSPGWWLCSLHGRQGIAPANRLRLLHTAPPPAAPGAPAGAELPHRAPAEDSVYLSPPGPALSRTHVSASAEDIDGVYRGPTAAGEGLYQSPGLPASRPGELRREDGGRPRSHSSSGVRPRPDWDMGPTGRSRSPSLRGRGSEAGTLYQTPTTPPPSGALLASEAVYLSPSGTPRAAEDPQDSTYLVPRETAAGLSERYAVVRGTPPGGDDVYQTPTGGATQATPVCCNGTPLVSQETPAVYQSPAAGGAGAQRNPTPASPLAAHQKQASSPGPKVKVVPPNPAVARGKAGPAAQHRGSPLLVRASQGRVPGSPNFARKPPPPAPPIRGVTRKDVQQTASAPPPAPAAMATPSPSGPKAQPTANHVSREGALCGLESKNNAHNKKAQTQDYEDPVDEQVYDTPPTGRWQRPVPGVSLDVNDGVGGDDDGIYNTPRALPHQADSLSEVYNVPTITLNASATDLQLTALAAMPPEDVDEVYSVPTLPGVAPLGPGEDDAPPPVQLSACQADCGIYDMPALTVDGLPHSSSSSSSSASTRRLSVSSNGSGDLQWRSSLSGLVQSVLAAASGPASALSSRDLAASLAEILSNWKASHGADPPPPLHLAWARLSELLPALSAAGHAPPADALLALVQRALDESLLLLQAQGRPRLPSQDSLSRRPLPALPVAAADGGKSSGGGSGGGGGGGGGMGSRKGSWIQERPLPPTPQPAFPLPAAPGPVTLTLGCGGDDDEDDPSNEYAGIGLTPAPAPLPTGDSVGYVKLQGKPEPPPPEAPAENGLSITAETRVTPSPPLPVSLSLEDSELLSFYSSQSLAHLSCLADAIDGLFASVQGNQPPRVFVARGKSLIVTAHKLVFIGDTLSRLLSSPDLRAKVTTSGGRLCQALKTVVVATKGAAQNYPSVTATQEMVDRVAELSQQAAGFSGLLQRLAEIS